MLLIVCIGVELLSVSFSISSLFDLMIDSTCLECHLVLSSATSSSVDFAICSTTLFADACPVALAVVES